MGVVCQDAKISTHSNTNPLLIGPKEGFKKNIYHDEGKDSNMDSKPEGIQWSLISNIIATKKHNPNPLGLALYPYASFPKLTWRSCHSHSFKCEILHDILEKVQKKGKHKIQT